MLKNNEKTYMLLLLTVLGLLYDLRHFLPAK